MKDKIQNKEFFRTMGEMKSWLLLWSTQSFSGLGSAMTSYALVIWSYTQRGSALMTALLMVSSYAPYVLLSIFAGALSDKWNKKLTMLACDTLAAASTVVMLFLLKSDALQIWHLYVINGINGVMNTVQQPACEVATTRVLPRKHYQRVGGLRYFASSLNSIMTPIIATAVLGIAGMDAIVAFDLFTFGVAFMTLAFGRTPLVWCIGGFLGWIAIPLMSTNLDAIMRLHVPEQMQGRVYSVRNSLQFFTIPIGYFMGGFLVDRVFEPIMKKQSAQSVLVRMFGSGKGSGAAFLFFVIAFAGIGVCLYFRRDKHIWALEESRTKEQA